MKSSVLHPPTPDINEHSTVEAVIRHYLEYLKGKRRPDTVKAYRLTYDKLLRLWGAHPPAPKTVSQITVDMLKPLPGWLNAQGLAASSVSRHLSAVLQLVGYLFREGLATQIDARGYENIIASYRDARKARQTQRLPRVPGHDVIDAVMETAQQVKVDEQTTKATKRRRELARLRDIAVLELLRATGLRVGELVALQRWNLDWENQRLLIEVSKSKTPRSLSVDDKAWRDVEAYLEARKDRGTTRPLHTFPLFARHDKRAGKKVLPISVRSIERIVSQMGQTAGIEMPLTPHSFRHQMGTDLVRVTGNIEFARLALGHEHISTTQRYAQLARADVDEAMRQVGRFRQERREESSV